jgi:hypothetical protein
VWPTLRWAISDQKTGCICLGELCQLFYIAAFDVYPVVGMLNDLILKFQYWLEGDLQAKKAEVRAAANRFGYSFYYEILADTERCPHCRQITLGLVRRDEGDICHGCWKHQLTETL